MLKRSHLPHPFVCKSNTNLKSFYYKHLQYLIYLYGFQSSVFSIWFKTTYLHLSVLLVQKSDNCWSLGTCSVLPISDHMSRKYKVMTVWLVKNATRSQLLFLWCVFHLQILSFLLVSFIKFKIIWDYYYYKNTTKLKQAAPSILQCQGQELVNADNLWKRLTQDTCTSLYR